MDPYELAARMYAIARGVLDSAAEAKLLDDELLWATEDLEEILLDLKLALIRRQEAWMEHYMLETTSLIVLIQDLSRSAPDDGDDPSPNSQG